MHLVGVWVGPEPVWTTHRKIFLMLPGLELRPLVVQAVTGLYTDCATVAPVE
jgi:hypothetical protein